MDLSPDLSDDKIGFLYPLPDGTRIYLRPIRPEDKQRLAQGYRMLSEHSRRLRFFLALPDLKEDYLEYLTHVDQKNHVAWGALDPSHPELPGVGVGRFIRLREAPDTAEVAIVVLDEWQHKGVGMVLAAVLYLRAWDVGIRVFRAYILPENEFLLNRLREFGTACFHFEEGLWQVDITLRPLDNLPPTPLGRRLKHVVERILQIQPALMPRAWKHPSQ